MLSGSEGSANWEDLLSACQGEESKSGWGGEEGGEALGGQAEGRSYRDTGSLVCF